MGPVIQAGQLQLVLEAPHKACGGEMMSKGCEESSHTFILPLPEAEAWAYICSYLP